MSDIDDSYMSKALDLAKKAWGDTHPNPMVGAILVKDGRIIAQGYHHKDGLAHAEIDCLSNATQSVEGATMYVTLEPCSTAGRTGACCDAIIRAGIKKVCIGTLDPNESHSGKALAVFKAHNIEVKTPILETQCRELNNIFNYSIVEKKAFIALKYAISSDGKIAEKVGVSTKITSAKSKADVMKWRKLYQCIGIGRGTLEIDNPSLTIRDGDEVTGCPIRLIFDAKLNISKNKNLETFKVFSDEYKDKTIVVCDKSASLEDEQILKMQGINVLRIESKLANGKDFWQKLKTNMYSKGITSIYIEGGAGLIKSVCDAKAVDYVFEYKSPLVLGCDALNAFQNNVRPFDIVNATEIQFCNDILTLGNVKWK